MANSPSLPRAFDLGTAALYLLMLGVVAAYVAEFVGPSPGWLEHARDGLFGVAPAPDPLAPGPGTGTGSDTAPLPPNGATEAPLVIPPPPPPVAVEPPAAPPSDNEQRVQQRFQKLYDEALAKLPLPVVGQPYRVRLRAGGFANGTLTQRTRDDFVLEEKHGEQVVRQTLTMMTVAVTEWARFFPENIAEVRAWRQVGADAGGTGASASTGSDGAGDSGSGPTVVSAGDLPPVAVTPPPVVVTPAPVKPPTPVTPVTPVSPPATKPPAAPVTPPAAEPPAAAFAYDPTPAATPPHLASIVAEYGNWLNAQQRRIGGTLVTKIYAKEDQGCAILYQVMVPGFRRLDRDTRQQLAESFWRFWALRCTTNGKVKSDRQAHLVFVSDTGRIIGGSTPQNAASIWVER